MLPFYTFVVLIFKEAFNPLILGCPRCLSRTTKGDYSNKEDFNHPKDGQVMALQKAFPEDEEMYCHRPVHHQSLPGQKEIFSGKIGMCVYL